MISTKVLGTGTFLFVLGMLAIGAYTLKVVPDPNVFAVGAGSALLGLVLMGLGFLTLRSSVESDGHAPGMSIALCLLNVIGDVCYAEGLGAHRHPPADVRAVWTPRPAGPLPQTPPAPWRARPLCATHSLSLSR